MKKSILFVLMFFFLMVVASGCSPASTPAPTPTPTLLPHSLVVIKSTLSGDLLGVLIRNIDSDGEKLDTMGLGFLCLSQGIYAVDESDSRLKCVQVTDATDNPNQIAIIFSGASSEHKYQLVRGEDSPIELLPEQLTP
jgi:hypothetical protein